MKYANNNFLKMNPLTMNYENSFSKVKSKFIFLLDLFSLNLWVVSLLCGFLGGLCGDRGM